MESKDFPTTGTDITERKLRREVKQVRTKKELHRSPDPYRELIATVSHELRSPLNVIIGSADILREGDVGTVSEEQKQFLDMIAMHAQCLYRQFEVLLSFFKAHSGKLSPTPSTFSVREVLEPLLVMAQVLQREKNVRVHWQVEKGLPPITSDPALLTGILQNLLTNAFKYTPEGTVEIDVRRGESGGWIAFTVKDTGIGIEKKDISVIFEKFRQVDGKCGGLGLGLALVKEYARILGAKIMVESEPGKGSAFTVLLPRNMRSAGNGQWQRD